MSPFRKHKPSADDIADQIDEKILDAQDHIEEARERGERTWQRAAERGREAIDEARRKGEEFWRSAADEGRRRLKDGKKYVRHNPSRSGGATLLFGFVAGAVLVTVLKAVFSASDEKGIGD